MDRELCEKELEELSEALNLQLHRLQENIRTVRNLLSKFFFFSFRKESKH